MSRAALLFVGATVGASCGGSTESGSSFDGGREAAADSGSQDGSGEDGEPVTLYGPGPVFDAGPRDGRSDAPSDAPSTDAPSETGNEGGGAVLYGPAMIDGSSEG